MFIKLFFNYQGERTLDRIILSFRKPFLSFYIYLLLIWLFMFILESSIKK